MLFKYLKYYIMFTPSSIYVFYIYIYIHYLEKVKNNVIKMVEKYIITQNIKLQSWWISLPEKQR